MNTKRFRLQGVLFILVLIISLFGPQGQASAQTAQVINPAASALDIANAIAFDPTWVTGASFVAEPPVLNTANAVSDTPLTSFPTHGSSYGILTTGAGANVGTPGLRTRVDLHGTNLRGNTDFDVTILKIDLQVPASNNCLTLNFQFFSEEFPQFVVNLYNDAFIAELDNSTWSTSGQNISAPNNFAFDQAGGVVSIHSTGVAQMDPGNAIGTAFDNALDITGNPTDGGATVLLSASTPITPGHHSLYLSIFDQKDNIYDSAVFLDNIILRNVLPPKKCGGPVAPAVDLSLSKSDAPDPVTAGGTLTYTLTVTNNGPNDATGVTLTDTLPAGVTFVSAAPTQGICTPGPVVSCDLGNLANGASAIITIVATVDPTTPAGTITNTASVTGKEDDPNIVDNTASTETLVINPADLSITKSDSPDPATAGGSLTYTLTATNNGPGDAPGVTVTDTLPAGVTFDPTTSSPGCSEVVSVVTCDLGDLANAASATVTIGVIVDPGAACDSTLTNTAVVASAVSDPDASNNTASTDTTVICPTQPCTILDDFNRPDGPLGSDWDGHTAGYRILGNEVTVRLGGPVYWQPEAYGPDQEACVTLTRINPKSKQNALLLKVQELNDWRQGAILVSYNARTGNVEVQARDVSNHNKWVLVGSLTPPTPVVDGDQLRAQALADGTVEVFINDTSLGTADAGSFYAGKGGQIGLWFLGRQGDDDDDGDSENDDRLLLAREKDGEGAEDDGGSAAHRALFDDFGGGTIAAP